MKTKVKLETETWMPVYGYPNYEVSNFGRVKSKLRIKVDKHGVVKKYNNDLILKTNLRGKGLHLYMFVNLYNNEGKKAFVIHRLVAQAFLNNDKNLTEVNHIDSNKLNNKVENLEWVTKTENMKHCMNNMRHPNIIKKEDIDNIVELWDQGNSASFISNETGRTVYSIRGITSRYSETRRFKHKSKNQWLAE